MWSKLIDYDQAINDCNWHWVWSLVSFAPRYKKSIFNPSEQSQIYDPHGYYIKRWLPNLKDIPVDHLHNWSRYHVNHDLYALDYVMPCLENYEEWRDKCLVMYNRARYKSQHSGVTSADLAQKKGPMHQKVGTQLYDAEGRMYIKEAFFSPEICLFSWIRPISFQIAFLDRLAHMMDLI